mgnify:FL=1
MIHITPAVPTSGLFMHTLADLTGGVTIASTHLGGAYLYAGTPIGKGSDGCYEVEKIARTLYITPTSSKELKIAKGHHFLVGDYIAADMADGQKIVSVNKQHAEYDILTLEQAFTVEIAKDTPLFASEGNNRQPKVTAVALIAHTTLVPREGDLYCSAWLIGVVKEERSQPIAKTLREQLKLISFI